MHVAWLLTLAAVSCCRAAPGGGLAAGLRVARALYKNCQEQHDVLLCLKSAALRTLDRAAAAPVIGVLEGLSLVRAAGSGAAPPPPGAELGHEQVNRLLVERALELVRDYKASLNVARILSLDTADDDKYLQMVPTQPLEQEEEGGRTKKRKKMDKGMMMMGMMMKGMMMAIAYKSVALLAGKALLVGKIALVLVLVMIAKKMFGGGGGGSGGGGGGGGGHVTYEIIKTSPPSHHHASGGGGDYGGGDGGGYAREDSGFLRRSTSSTPDYLAYRGHVPP